LHDEGEGIDDMLWEVAKFPKCGVGRYVGVHADCVADEEPGCRREGFLFLEASEASKVVDGAVDKRGDSAPMGL